jgi:hypothetical protein
MDTAVYLLAHELRESYRRLPQRKVLRVIAGATSNAARGTANMTDRLISGTRRSCKSPSADWDYRASR